MAVVVLSIGVVTAAPPEPEVEIQFGPEGVTALTWNGKNFWAGGEPAITNLHTGVIDAKNISILGKRLDFQVDAEKGRIVADYEGAKLTCDFVAKGNRLDVLVEVLNKSAEPCDWVEVSIGRLNLLQLMENQPNGPGGSMGVDNKRRLGLRRLTAKDAVIGLGNWEVKNPAMVNTGPVLPALKGTPILVSSPRVMNRPTHPIVEDHLFEVSRRVVEPGESTRFHLSLSFGSPDMTNAELVPDLFQHIAKERPMQLEWPDRRPVGTLFIAQSNAEWPTNPRGYIFGLREKNDVTTPEGREAFGQALMAYADRSVEILKEMDAQGVIVWDLEGQQAPHMISYVADPRVLKEAAPEMDQFADAFFKKFSDAGLKTGITLRPTKYVPAPDSRWGWTQAEVPNPVEDISERITYAKERWGCTIFYLDSNIFNNDWLTPEQKEAKKHVPFLLPVSMMEELNRRFPDVLIIPEWASPQEHTVSAPYASPNLRQRGTARDVRAIYPEAFSVVMTNRHSLEEDWETYARNVQGGDVLLFLAWYPDPGNELVKVLYDEKAIREQGAPKEITGGDVNALTALAEGGDVRMKYFVAEALGESGNRAAVPVLLGLLDDSNPLVRKQAVQALGRLKPQDAAVAERMFQILQDKESGMLAPFAAVTLGSTGSVANPWIDQLLDSPKDHRQEQMRQYGLVAAEVQPGVVAPETVGKILLLMKEGNQITQEAAIRVLGGRKVVSAVPDLITMLDDPNEFLSLASVRALGKIGDRKAVAPIVALFKRQYGTTVTYSIRNVQDATLRSLTGESESKTAAEWEAYVQN